MWSSDVCVISEAMCGVASMLSSGSKRSRAGASEHQSVEPTATTAAISVLHVGHMIRVIGSGTEPL